MFPLLEHSAYMSDEVSDLDDATEEARKAHRESCVQAAELSQRDRQLKIAVWERVRPAYRSEEVCTLLEATSRFF